jgi:hypothetical protein
MVGRESKAPASKAEVTSDVRRWNSCTIRQFARVVKANMNVAQQIVEALLEGDEKPKKSMPPWLQKKISGKKDDDEGDGDGGGDGADKEKKDDKDGESEKSNVGSVTGSKKDKDGDKVEHTF